MKIFYLVLLAVFLFSLPAISQNRYWVFFQDKKAYQSLTLEEKRSLVDQYLSERAKDRRSRRGLSSFNKSLNYEDLPPSPTYISQIEQMGFQIHTVSRWFNAVSGSASESALSRISDLPFVRSVEPVNSWDFSGKEENSSSSQAVSIPQQFQSFDFDYGPSTLQIQFHNIDKLHDKELSGEGVVVALFDTGFRPDNPSLQHIRSQLIAEYDFVQGDSITSNQKDDSPSQDTHGTAVLSIIGGLLDGTLIGPAFGAQFILAKTEIVDEEIHLEEDNWTMAAEWAEALGADIVSTSLGYSIFDSGQFNYSYGDMDGNTAIITRAANELAKRGVLVVSSAGNEGNTPWRHITAPADGFYVLAVGALNSSNEVASFSSRGPTADGRLKPDVSGLGVGVYRATTGSSFQFSQGTSVSCPLVAGIAAQLLQAVPELNLLNLLDILRRSADSAANPDNNRGWGKVDALAAWSLATGNIFKRPEKYLAEAPRPNPYIRGGGIIFFPVDLPKPALLTIDIYNILGQRVVTLRYQGTQSHNLVLWDGRNFNGHPVPDGIYIFKIHTAEWEKFGKITVIN